MCANAIYLQDYLGVRERTTKPNVFVIESLDFDDEENEMFEGKILSQILHLGDKKSEYYYIRTKRELEEVLKLFRKSDYRYLHLSCHGSTKSISTTLDCISFSQFGNLVRPYLKDKRLFISACSAVNDNLAKTVIPSSKCLSIIGSTKKVSYNDAAIMWASFYHLMFQEDPQRMKRRNIESTLRKLAKTFGVPLNYFSISKGSKEGYKRTTIPSK